MDPKYETVGTSIRMNKKILTVIHYKPTVANTHEKKIGCISWELGAVSDARERKWVEEEAF
ncbi:hypothetical protein VCV18_002647 [Metarhizium anisopliae]